MKDLRLAKKRNLDLSELDDVVMKLANQEKLEAKYHDHALYSEYKDFRECHVKPDWLLVYAIERRDFKLRQSAIIVVDETNKSDNKSSCRGIAAAYANPKLIEKESEYISKVFSGD